MRMRKTCEAETVWLLEFEYKTETQFSTVQSCLFSVCVVYS